MTAFFVEGIPAPQGSKVQIRPGVMIDDNAKRLKPWRNAVVVVARAAHRGPPLGPCKVKLRFRMKPPQKDTRTWPSIPPDLDKLARAVFDGLTIAGVVEDDARIVWMVAMKEYDWDGRYGVHVEVEEIDA